MCREFVSLVVIDFVLEFGMARFVQVEEDLLQVVVVVVVYQRRSSCRLDRGGDAVSESDSFPNTEGTEQSAKMTLSYGRRGYVLAFFTWLGRDHWLIEHPKSNIEDITTPFLIAQVSRVLKDNKYLYTCHTSIDCLFVPFIYLLDY